MVSDIAWLFLSVVILTIAAFVLSPQRAQCSPGWFVDGIRPSGSFECLRDRDPTAGNESSRGHDVLEGKLDCAPSFMPVVLDDRRVACLSQATIP